MEKRFSFTKSERLCSRKAIDTLFDGSGKAFSAFPLRVVYMPVEVGDAAVSVLVSVPKRRLHHAVDRNRVKRLVREAYRLQKHLLVEPLQSKPYSLHLAFIYQAETVATHNAILLSVRKALQRISERLPE